MRGPNSFRIMADFPRFTKIWTRNIPGILAIRYVRRYYFRELAIQRRRATAIYPRTLKTGKVAIKQIRKLSFVVGT